MTFATGGVEEAHPALHEPPSSIRETPPSAFHASPTALVRASGSRVWLVDLVRRVAIGAAAGLFLAFAAAFETDIAPLPVRLAYWVGVCVLGSLAGAVVLAAATRVGGLAGRRWVLGTAVFAALTAILTPTIWAVTQLVFHGRLEVSTLPAFAAPVAIVTAAMTALSFALNHAPVLTHAAAPQTPASGGVVGEDTRRPRAQARFLDRLPPKLRGATLFGVESEDHYLRLHTSRGQDLILLRLSDALAELDGLEGAQTHRSWWVARDGFEDVRRADGRALLRLKNGVEAPVSRTHAKALRQAGWF